MTSSRPTSGTHSTWTRSSRRCSSICSTQKRQRGGWGWGSPLRAPPSPRLLELAWASYEGRNLGFVTCSAMSTRLVPPCIWVWLLPASDLLPFSTKDAGAAMGLCCLGIRVSWSGHKGTRDRLPSCPSRSSKLRRCKCLSRFQMLKTFPGTLLSPFPMLFQTLKHDCWISYGHLRAADTEFSLRAPKHQTHSVQ